MCQLFADDAKIFRGISSKDDVASLQVDLDNLCEWSEKWQLVFNVGKIQIAAYRQQKHSSQVSDEWKRTGAHRRRKKDLGVLIDESLGFHRQAAADIKKTNGFLGSSKERS